MKEDIIEIIKLNLIEIIPDLENVEFSIDETFINLGANSLDRGELITLTLEKLNLNFSRIDFVSAQTVEELSNLIMKKKELV